MTEAMTFLDQVAARAKEMYAISDQGRWEDLHPDLQAMWINAAGEELREKGEDR